MALHRRELLLVGAGLVAAKATAATLACAKESTMEEDDKKPAAGTKPAGAKPADKAPAETKAAGDPHAGHGGGDEASSGPDHASFVAALADCTEKGQVCLQHCITLLSKGETSMAECAAAVNDMMSICQGMGALALSKSKHLQAAAKLCHDLCSDCAAACKPHVAHHASCKACAEACEATMAEASKLV
ncbi:MAG: Csp1 family four helix bundle copper storage protein [Myxococcota bacterium]